MCVFILHAVSCQLIYSACVRVREYVFASLIFFFCHFILILSVNANQRRVIEMENIRKKGHLEKEGKKIRTDKRNLLVLQTSILLILLKLPLCIASFSWHSLLKVHSFDGRTIHKIIYFSQLPL